MLPLLNLACTAPSITSFLSSTFNFPTTQTANNPNLSSTSLTSISHFNNSIHPLQTSLAYLPSCSSSPLPFHFLSLSNFSQRLPYPSLLTHHSPSDTSSTPLSSPRDALPYSLGERLGGDGRFGWWLECGFWKGVNICFCSSGRRKRDG